MYVTQITILYTLNSAVCQLYLNKIYMYIKNLKTQNQHNLLFHYYTVTPEAITLFIMDDNILSTQHWSFKDTKLGNVYLWLICVDVWQKPTHFYKAIILQLKINKFKKNFLRKKLQINRTSLAVQCLKIYLPVQGT